MDRDFIDLHGLPQLDEPAKIIGLCGRAGVGKDTFMAALPDSMGVVSLRLAGKLKEFYELCTGEEVNWDHPHSKTDPAKGFQCTRRYWLEHVGEGLCEFNPLFWVIVWANELHSMPASPEPVIVIVPDVRKPIEAEVIQAYGGVVVRIVRPSIEKKDDGNPSTRHIDEVDHDYLISNSSTIEAFEDSAAGLFETIIKEQKW